MKTVYKKVTIGEKACYSSTHYEVVEHKGKKFLIFVKADNGSCLGFNSDCCISVMTSDGDWEHVVDNREIGAKFDKDGVYYGSTNEGWKKILLEEPVKAFKEYIQKVY